MNDSDRPPVLAHQRFAADRASFQGLDLRGRFERIHRVNLWGAATSASGLGSEQPAIAALATALPPLLRELKVASLLDAPCGDALWINRLNGPARRALRRGRRRLPRQEPGCVAARFAVTARTSIYTARWPLIQTKETP
jgi:hypothetical protein